MKTSLTTKRKLQLVRRRHLLMLKQQKQQLLGSMQLMLVDLLLMSKKQLPLQLPVNCKNGGRPALLGNQLQMLNAQLWR